MMMISMQWMVLLVACFYTQLTAAAVSEEWCRLRGFDPSNLSCDTCALIDESTSLQKLQKEKNAKAKSEDDHIDISAECRACCQEYKVREES